MCMYWDFLFPFQHVIQVVYTIKVLLLIRINTWYLKWLQVVSFSVHFYSRLCVTIFIFLRALWVELFLIVVHALYFLIILFCRTPKWNSILETLPSNIHLRYNKFACNTQCVKSFIVVYHYSPFENCINPD